MQDRVAIYPGRVLLTPVLGEENVYDMTRNDSPTTEGTPLNTENLLSNSVAEGLGLDPITATPNAAFEKLANQAKQAEVTVISIYLTANWEGDASPYSQVVSIPDVTVTKKVDLQPAPEQINALIENGTNCLMAVNNNGTVTIYAFGEKPAETMSIQATLTEVSV